LFAFNCHFCCQKLRIKLNYINPTQIKQEKTNNLLLINITFVDLFIKTAVRTTKQKIETNNPSKTNFFKTVLADKRAMHEYIKKHGSLNGFTSDHFEFAKPL
jgi:hypothetical protein